ncbi:uncharacterized protein LOC132338947 [Haemorhous mexicanus]|uniref:uncharacterized protein LOC132338947 n=1 Tax=Haemorhous mexicanus TaxID=30427 RepID=UPI0028BEBEC0|nr:uncharacterized protein LOC132338947 [Haemorhous mexicanus]
MDTTENRMEWDRHCWEWLEQDGCCWEWVGHRWEQAVTGHSPRLHQRGQQQQFPHGKGLPGRFGVPTPGSVHGQAGWGLEPTARLELDELPGASHPNQAGTPDGVWSPRQGWSWMSFQVPPTQTRLEPQMGFGAHGKAGAVRASRYIPPKPGWNSRWGLEPTARLELCELPGAPYPNQAGWGLEPTARLELCELPSTSHPNQAGWGLEPTARPELDELPGTSHPNQAGWGLEPMARLELDELPGASYPNQAGWGLEPMARLELDELPGASHPNQAGWGLEPTARLELDELPGASHPNQAGTPDGVWSPRQGWSWTSFQVPPTQTRLELQMGFGAHGKAGAGRASRCLPPKPGWMGFGAHSKAGAG